MNELASRMADRIRASVAAQPTVSGPALSEAFRADVSAAIKNNYGVSLDEVTALFVPGNDIVWAAAEGGVSVEDFTKTLASQYSFSRVSGLPADQARYLAGENSAKLALAEFSQQEDDQWTFSDGYAVGEIDNHLVAVSASFVDSTGGWEFSSAVYPGDVDSFINASPAEKAAMPSEQRVYGDIGEVVGRSLSHEVEMAAPRM